MNGNKIQVLSKTLTHSIDLTAHDNRTKYIDTECLKDGDKQYINTQQGVDSDIISTGTGMLDS